MTTLKRKADTLNAEEDDDIRSKLKLHHESLRNDMRAEHAKELAKLEETIQKELNEDFATCEFVINAKAEKKKADDVASVIGFCSICRTTALTKDGEEFIETEDDTRDCYDPTDFDGEVCYYCAQDIGEHVSVKCDNCVWPMTCSNKQPGKKGKHGFCQHCIDMLNMSHEEAYEKYDIPVRIDPGHSDGPVERDYLHPFHMCDCGICAWCGDENDACCQDHVYQLCSCYPETV